MKKKKKKRVQRQPGKVERKRSVQWDITGNLSSSRLTPVTTQINIILVLHIWARVAWVCCRMSTKMLREIQAPKYREIQIF